MPTRDVTTSLLRVHELDRSTRKPAFRNIFAPILLTALLYILCLRFILSHQRTLMPSSMSVKVDKEQIQYDPHYVLKKYMEEHSVDQLRRECPTIGQKDISLEKHCPMIQDRRFAVGFYSCPHQAGNRLHHFMNAMAWAIATNRTLLWKYYDKKTCSAIGRHYDKSICYKTGTKEKCEEILHLSDWIPSFDEWFPLLHLGSGEEVPYYSTHAPPTNSTIINHKHAFHKGDASHARIDTKETRLLHFGQLLGQDFRSLHTKKTREYLLHTEEARTRAYRLLGDGEILQAGDYLYGMLFHVAFSFTDLFLNVVNSSTDTLFDHNETMIAIHSRHYEKKNDGSNVSREVECLKHMLRPVIGPCRVFVMSDRPKAVKEISKAITDMNCSTTTFHHQEHSNYTSFSSEHGPFDGAGFFMDLALASKARHGLVGTRRSSTMLLAELIAYQNGVNGEYNFCNYEKNCLCTTTKQHV